MSSLPNPHYEESDKGQPIPPDQSLKNKAPATATSQKPRPIQLFAALGLLVAAVLFTHSLHYPSYQHRRQTVMSQSPLTSWPLRATPHPSQSTFTPTASSLQYGMIRSTPVHPSQLVAAFFEPDFVVDAAGRVLKLSDDDAHGINTLVQTSVGDDVPKPGGFRNQWRISHSRTSMPIHWLKVFNAPGKGGELQDVSIYGYSSEKTELSKSVHGLLNLPDVLQETFGVLDEARTSNIGGEGSSELAQQVAEMVTGI